MVAEKMAGSENAALSPLMPLTIRERWRAGPPDKGSRPPARAGRRGLRSGKAQAKADTKAAHGELPQWSTAEIDEAFRRFAAANPAPRGELEHIDPFTLLVAVVLSAQATDAGVNKATPALFKLADTPEKMIKLGEARVRTLIKTIGLYRTKAKNLLALSRQLVAEHGGKVPHDRAALEALPGVGRKTANVVLNVAFGEPTIAVDTHIFRVGNRTGLAVGKTPLDVEMKLMEVVPERYRLHAHHWLILHGRYVCVARRPLCEKCLIADLCKWPGKTVEASSPAAVAATAGDDARSWYSGGYCHARLAASAPLRSIVWMPAALRQTRSRPIRRTTSHRPRYLLLASFSASSRSWCATSGPKSSGSWTWRISITSLAPAGQRLAHSIASSRDFTRISQ